MKPALILTVILSIFLIGCGVRENSQANVSNNIQDSSDLTYATNGTTQEQTTVAIKNIVETTMQETSKNISDAIFDDGIDVSHQGDDGHITVITGEIVSKGLLDGERYIILATIIDNVCYMDTYFIDTEEWVNLEMDQSYSLKEGTYRLQE